MSTMTTIELQEYLLYFEQREKDVRAYEDYICYSPRYYDDIFEYRHVTLPKQLVQYVPLDRLMPEEEWRSLGVKQSYGWEHYMIHAPEPHILLFKREKDYQEKYGIPQPEEELVELVEQDGQQYHQQNVQYHQQNVQYQQQNVQYHQQNVQYHQQYHHQQNLYHHQQNVQ
ncbi:regulatory subunit of cyclin-dependent kinase [Gigaspora rosea]|uniref:Cyclin-dependent kinases regulatory subunit n=1 Tax=Gigaspora rosea TaxID=44941 RepID=A0A397UV03_9GLOM|nr:regulatory subunit of cyclin-dependent kinase [Gigaspora rosea]